jgi:hypothetical protein
MSSLSETLALSQFMLKGVRVLAVDWPTSWLMEQMAPPQPPDLTKLDMEAKLRILRGEEPDWTPEKNWWSPIAWIDQTEQWVNQWIDTSK